MKKSNYGSVFLIVIGVLSVIFFIAASYIASTMGERRLTEISIHGLHATCLAEAALERGMRIIQEDINRVDVSTTSPNALSVLLRLPATANQGNTLGLSGNLGVDELLNLPSEATTEIVLTKDDLQKDGNNQLDELVSYVTKEADVKYEVNLKIKLSKALRISPGSKTPTYQVPGVDIPWHLRKDVENFLDGQGYTPFELAFPKDMSWVNFTIPVKFGPVTIVDINIKNIVNKLVPQIYIGGEYRTFNDLTSFDTAAELIFNNVAPFFGSSITYPFEIKFDQINMPTSVSELWPAGVTLNPGQADQYFEKYGQLSIQSEAKITYPNGHTARRVVTAIKDFKVADCEPIAPMYSLFIANVSNAYLSFNNYGGNFTVKNQDFGGVVSGIKDAFNGPKNLTATELAQKDIPGLIRVNYTDPTGGDRPLICNVSLVGDWGAPTVQGDSSGFASQLLSGLEAPLILNAKTKMALAGGKYSLNADIARKDPASGQAVPVDWKLYEKVKAGTAVAAPVFDGERSDYGASYQPSYSKDKLKETLQTLVNPGAISLIPNVSKMSTNVISLAITLALKPLGQVKVLKDLAVLNDCFTPSQWDMPYMGTKNSLYSFPTAGTASNKTSFFGASGLSPTLTREIEGNVLKRFRRWKMVLVGLNPADRLPLLPFPPIFVPPPGFPPIPIWFTSDVLTKYDYEMEPLKAIDDSGKRTKNTNEYDPAKLANMPPNLYTTEQYVKKATYYYSSYQEFLDDLDNRMVEVNGKKIFLLNGVNYISDTLGSGSLPFAPNGSGNDFLVMGKGSIVATGNLFLGCSIRTVDKSEEELTIFSLILAEGGILMPNGGVKFDIEGSLYTDKGISSHANSSLHIIGNWTTNNFSKPAMGGTVNVSFASSRVRSSIGSLHPERGKFEPNRYHVSFSPTWSSWKND